jgi:hypothetical protein
MAYDSARQRVVLFGGEPSSGAVMGDTWEYNGATSTWTQRATTGPSARRNTVLVYDPLRAVTVLFGGTNAAAANNETWEWNGTTWAQKTPTTSPTARYGASGVWDPVRQRVVVFGGNVANVYSNEVYEYDGTTWTLRTGLGTAPGGRYAASVAWDQGRSRLVMTSGSTTSALSDTWELGAAWQQVSAAPLAPARYFAAAAFHAAMGRVLVAGGTTTASVSASFSYDGASWTALSSAPSSRGWVTMAYDSTRGKAVLFGGYSSVSSTYLGDTWEY